MKTPREVLEQALENVDKFGSIVIIANYCVDDLPRMKVDYGNQRPKNEYFHHLRGSILLAKDRVKEHGGVFDQLLWP